MDNEDLLVSQYRETFPAKLMLIREHIDLLKKEGSLDALDLLRRDVHKLAGSSGTYGFTTASNLCKSKDLELQEKLKNFNLSGLSPEWFSNLDQFYKELEKTLEKPDIAIKFLT